MLFLIINWPNFVYLLVLISLKNRGSFPHRMDAPDRHNEQRDKRTNERTDGWTKTSLFVRPSVRLLDGVWHYRRRASTIILSYAVKYSTRDLICGINYCAQPAKSSRYRSSSVTGASVWTMNSTAKQSLGGNSCKNFFDLPYFLVFVFSINILSYTLILHISQLQSTATDDVTNQVGVEYLIQTYNILVLLLHRNLTEKYSFCLQNVQQYSG